MQAQFHGMFTLAAALPDEEPTMTKELDGMCAVVTGGGSGIGRSTAEMMASRGAQVAVLDLRPPTSAHSLFSQACDVGDADQVQAAVAAVGAEFGRIDIVVNSAGVGAVGDISVNDDAEWLRVLNVNVLGMKRVSVAALPWLVASPAAGIVNIGSVAGSVGLSDRALYSASKGAVHALTRAMAADLLPHRIRVNAVAPGTADTPWVRRLLEGTAEPAAELAALQARQPHGRLVLADEVAAAVCYLAGPSASSTTGAIVAVDGGMQSLRPRPTPDGQV
jgi:2-keto-3-deoxy-L-fuconate dehydrogenase